MSEFGVNLVGHFNAAVGLGEAARASLRALDAAGIPCVLNDCDLGIRHHIETESDLASRMTGDAPYRFDLVHINPNWIPEFPQIFTPDRSGGHYRIGYWLWETLKFPPEWTFAFDLFDEIWTSSWFCVESISRVSPVPVLRVPLAIEPRANTADTNAKGPAAKIPDGKFVFLFVFDFCSAYQRKNPVAVVRAFLSAFGGEDERVLLVIKSANAQVDVVGRDELRDTIAGSKNIRWINELLPREELQALMRRTDCYVSLHRAEGYGLTIAEAMALGKPVIATAYSGNMDMMTTANSYPVDYRLTEIKEGRDEVYKGKKDWAEPDVENAAALMQYVFESPDDATKKGARAAETIRTLFSPKAVGELIRNRLEVIDAWTPDCLVDQDGAGGLAETRDLLRMSELRVRHLEAKVSAMESSRFWKLRNGWFDLKRRLHISR